jgi:hypothetical protein
MKNKFCSCISIVLPLILISCLKNYPPLSLHPDNQHYFLFRGKPAILVGSTEHYGAVMNLDFDYSMYLDEISDKGMNIAEPFQVICLNHRALLALQRTLLHPRGGFICRGQEVTSPVSGWQQLIWMNWDEAYLKDFRTL